MAHSFAILLRLPVNQGVVQKRKEKIIYECHTTSPCCYLGIEATTVSFFPLKTKTLSSVSFALGYKSSSRKQGQLLHSAKLVEVPVPPPPPHQVVAATHPHLQGLTQKEDQQMPLPNQLVTL